MTDWGWDSEKLVTWEGVKLLSRPDLRTQEVVSKGQTVVRLIGDGAFFIEHAGNRYRVTVSSHYVDTAAKQFGGVQKGLKEGDLVDITLYPYPWTVKEHSGIKYYFYKIEKSPSRENHTT